MFKFFPLLVLLAAAVVCQEPQPETEQDAKLNPGISRCTKKLNLPANNDFSERYLQGDSNGSDPAYRKFIACLLGELGLTNENGIVQQKALIDYVGERVNREQVEQMLKACHVTVGQGDSADETAFKYYACMSN